VQLLVEPIAEAVTADATVLPLVRLELTWIAWSALDTAILVFCGVAASGAWNAASAIDDPIRAAGPKGDESVRRGHAWVICSVAQSKAMVSGALNYQEAVFKAS
jgi:hypothetical protein